jgi:hypothetical protein
VRWPATSYHNLYADSAGRDPARKGEARVLTPWDALAFGARRVPTERPIIQIVPASHAPGTSSLSSQATMWCICLCAGAKFVATSDDTSLFRRDEMVQDAHGSPMNPANVCHTTIGAAVAARNRDPRARSEGERSRQHSHQGDHEGNGWRSRPQCGLHGGKQPRNCDTPPGLKSEASRPSLRGQAHCAVSSGTTALARRYVEASEMRG